MEIDSAKVDAMPAMMTILGSFVAEATPRTSPSTFTTPSCPPRMISLSLLANPLLCNRWSARCESLFIMEGSEFVAYLNVFKQTTEKKMN